MIPLVAMLVAGVVLSGTNDLPGQPISDVQSIPMHDGADRPLVRVRGVITSRFYKPNVDVLLTVQDDTAAIWVRVVPQVLEGRGLTSLRPGDEIDVHGRLDAGGYAPRILADRVENLGKRPLPEPRPADIDRLFAGADNALRVSLCGVVQGYRNDGSQQSRLIVASASRRIIARVPSSLLRKSPELLVDSRVNVIGIVTAVRNTRGEFLAPQIQVASSRDVQVVEEPASGPFDAREVPLDAIAVFRPQVDLNRRVRTRGTVTAAFPGSVFYIQKGNTGVRVQACPGERADPGCEVEVAGFVEMGYGTGMICEAVCRTLSVGESQHPVAIQPTSIVTANERARATRKKIAKPGDYNGCLIEFQGEHVESHPPHDGWCRMTLMDGLTAVTTLLPEAAFFGISRIQPGSIVRCTGIADLKSSSAVNLPLYEDPSPDRVEVLIPSADRVAIVSVPSWWTPRRMRYALAATAGMVVVSLVTIQLLRRRIVAQATRLAEQIRARKDAALEFEAALRERARLASNLHDTVLQTVTGVSFQLRACRTAGEQDEDSVMGHLQFAERMVDHAVQQLRGTVWALHTVPAEGPSLTAALQTMVGRLREEHLIKIEARSEGIERGVAEAVAGNLLLVAQEAIHNAVRHGHATLVDVKVAYQNDGGVSVTIRDDGVGFDPDSRPGSSEGHFGLDGMRDRMQRMGGFLEFQSVPAEGTRVTARVPAASSPAPVLEDSAEARATALQ